MAVILFFGSGISRPSGFPLVDELTQMVLKNTYFRTTVENFFPGPPEQITTAPEFDETTRVQAFLNILYEYNNRFLSRNPWSSRRTNYEDLYYVCDQIDLSEHGVSDTGLAWQFVKHIESEAQHIIKQEIDYIPRDIRHFAKEATMFIQSVVWHAIGRRLQEVVGLNMLHEIVDHDKIDQSYVITVNHDTIHVGTDSYHAHDGVGNSLRRNSSIPMFLSGVGKERLYNSGIYGDMQDAFLRALDRSQSILMSGYGWNDLGISQRLLRWLNRDPSRKLILLHQSPDEIKYESRGMRADDFEELENTGQLIVIEKWFCDARLREIKKYLT